MKAEKKIKLAIPLVFLIFLMSFAFAEEWPICIDKQAPNPPGNLQVSGNVVVSFDEATDNPDCGMIDYYEIYRDDKLIAKVTSTTFEEGPLNDGTYDYAVVAVDSVGKKSSGVSKTITIGSTTTTTTTTNTGGSSRSSGGGSSFVPTTVQTCEPDWQCTEWSTCSDESQSRICTDLNECTVETDKPAEVQACTEKSIKRNSLESESTDGHVARVNSVFNTPELESTQEPETVKSNSITGAILGAAINSGLGATITLIALVALIGMLIGGYFYMKKK